jgi:hypothetical protein
MGKGIQNLWRYLEVGEAANRRYLEGLTPTMPTARALLELDSLCRGHHHDGRRIPRLNPVSDTDSEIFQAVLSGEHAISGLRNSDLQGRLYASPAVTLLEAKRRCARISRLIAKLRGHGLLAEVPGSRRYRVTGKGHRVMAAALRFRLKDFPAGNAA